MKTKNFHCFLLLAILLTTVCSCKDDNKTLTPEQSISSITIKEGNTHPVIAQEGGTIIIPFTATGDWMVSLMNDRAESWITVTPVSGKAGDVLLSISATINDTYDERNATIVLKCGDDIENIVVTQKQKDALLLSSSKYEVEAKGGEISVEVQANISFEVEVKADWIQQANTRTLTNNILNFSVTPNDTGEQRKGEIIIKNGTLSETVMIYQGYEDFIILTQKEFTLPERGGMVDIEIRSTVDYDVKIPDDIKWITEIQSRAVSTHTRHYTVAPNESYDAREAKIVFYSLENESLVDTVSIYQVQSGAILVARNEYLFERKGGALNFTVQSNLEFDVIILDNWIQQLPSTRSLTDYVLNFIIFENTEGKDREGTITIKSKDNSKQQVITIKQNYLNLEREALIALYKATNGDKWTNNTNWCSNKPISEWYGVYTNAKGHVYSLELPRNKMEGLLPKEFCNLKYLTNLNLQYNQFSGQIPDIIWSLPVLESLSLSGNQFTSISSEIKNAKNLKGLYISDNSITNFPESMGELTQLETLWADNIKLNGDFPLFICQLTSLKSLILSRNSLKGNIPDDIGNLKNLEDLHIEENKIEGYLPESICNLTNLKYLGINNNQIKGSIPESICNLIKLEYLYAGYNQITGNLPKNIGNLANLKLLTFDCNQLSGNLPESIGNLVYLESLSIGDNQIEGSIPESVCNLINLSFFNISNNNITGNLPQHVHKMRNMNRFWVNNNNLTGTLPKGIAELPLLESLEVQQNRLSGAIPIELYQCSQWSNWDSARKIYPQQDGYILYPENYYESTDYSKDGEVKILQMHSKGNGIKLVLMGDFFVDIDMNEGGFYDSMMEEAMEDYFSIEPFKSLREYFDVISIKAVSKHNWLGGESAFGTTIDWSYQEDECMKYAQKAVGGDNINDIQIILLVNMDSFGGQGGLGIAFCAFQRDSHKDLKSTINHESGHAFAKIHDEYIWSDTTFSDFDELDRAHEKGWSMNVDYKSDSSQVIWSHFINDPRYANEGIGVYEGALSKYGIYRPTEYSIMRESINGHYVIDQFNAPSREAIYKRAMKLAYGDSWTYDYEKFVKFDVQGHADFVAAKNKAENRSM